MLIQNNLWNTQYVFDTRCWCNMVWNVCKCRTSSCGTRNVMTTCEIHGDTCDVCCYVLEIIINNISELRSRLTDKTRKIQTRKIHNIVFDTRYWCNMVLKVCKCRTSSCGTCNVMTTCEIHGNTRDACCYVLEIITNNNKHLVVIIDKLTIRLLLYHDPTKLKSKKWYNRFK